MITPTEDIPEFCLDTDVPLTHFQGERVRPESVRIFGLSEAQKLSQHKRKRSWSETRNPPTDIFQDSYLSWTPEHTTIQMPPESISYIEQNYWDSCKITMRIFITLVCIYIGVYMFYIFI